MALFIPSPQVCKVELCYTQNDQQTENVFHCKHDAGDPTIGDMDLLAEFFKNWWSTNIKPYQQNATGLRLIRVTLLTDRSSPGIEYSTGLPIVGTFATGRPLPNNVCVTIKWLTGLRGRNYRGRTYVGGLSSDQVDGNSLVAGTKTALQTAADDLIDNMLAGWVLGVNSMYLDKLPRSTSEFTAFTGAVVEDKMDSQRRRLFGRGS
jgi:hypothetical protein